MSKNFHTPWDTTTEYTPNSMNPPLGDLDLALTYLKNILISCDGDLMADKNTGVVAWDGAIRIIFGNDAGIATENVIASGSITCEPGWYIGFYLDQTNGKIISMSKAQVSEGISTAPLAKNFIVLAYRNPNNGEFYLANVLNKLAAGNEVPGVKTVNLVAGLTAQPGQLLAITATGYDLADNTDLNKLQDVVIVKTGGTGTAVVTEYGYFFGGAGLTVGAPVYVGAGGVYTQTAPTTSGSWVKCVGWAISDTTIKFMPDTLSVQNI